MCNSLSCCVFRAECLKLLTQLSHRKVPFFGRAKIWRNVWPRLPWFQPDFDFPTIFLSSPLEVIGRTCEGSTPTLFVHRQSCQPPFLQRPSIPFASRRGHSPLPPLSGKMKKEEGTMNSFEDLIDIHPGELFFSRTLLFLLRWCPGREMGSMMASDGSTTQEKCEKPRFHLTGLMRLLEH